MKKIKEFFAEMFEFSKPHVAFTKFLNIMAVFTIDIFWLIFVLFVLISIGGLNKQQALQIVTATITVGWAEHIPILKTLMISQTFMFFLACVLAPIWETVCFVWGPIKFAQLLSSIAVKMGVPAVGIVAVFAVSFAIFFGILHGSALNICIQGVAGLLFCWLYLKNNNSYWSVVIAHAIWNFMIIFGLSFIMGV